MVFYPLFMISFVQFSGNLNCLMDGWTCVVLNIICRLIEILFLGTCIKPYRRYPASRTVDFFRRAVRRMETGCRPTIAPYVRLLQIRAVLNSYCGHLCHFKGYKVLDARFGRSSLKRFFDFSCDCRKFVLRKESVSVNMPFENEICYEERYDASKERL